MQEINWRDIEDTCILDDENESDIFYRLSVSIYWSGYKAADDDFYNLWVKNKKNITLHDAETLLQYASQRHNLQVFDLILNDISDSKDLRIFKKCLERCLLFPVLGADFDFINQIFHCLQYELDCLPSLIEYLKPRAEGAYFGQQKIKAMIYFLENIYKQYGEKEDSQND